MRNLNRLLRDPDPAVRLAAACRLAYRHKLVQALAGNASVRIPGGFLCTPTGCCLGEVVAEDLVRISEDGRPSGQGRATSEWALHACIYRADADVGAVLHTHSPAATARAVLGRDLPPLTPETAHHLGTVPCLPPVPPGTEAVGLGAAEALGRGARAALLGRHGAVAWGRDVREAFYQAELLEAACALAAAVDAANPASGRPGI